MNLKERYAIITGSGQGLGAAIAKHYVAAGASVLLCARSEETLEAVREKLSANLTGEQQLLIQKTDVSDPSQVDALIETALSAFPKLDILVNNAGVYGPLGPIEEVDWRDWIQTIHINLMGLVYSCRAVLPHFKKRRYGKIINLSGGGATAPLPGISAYSASKAAVVRFTETLADEVRRFNIDVNAVAPGALATRLMDQVIAAGPEKVGAAYHERMVKLKEQGGTPLEKGASLCVYLASAESDGITGKLISAIWDPWDSLPEHRDDLDGSDVYTLRRVIPKDRGMTWGDV